VRRWLGAGAKSNINVEEAFVVLARRVHQRAPKNKPDGAETDSPRANGGGNNTAGTKSPACCILL
jgi:hypothetical protein